MERSTHSVAPGPCPSIDVIAARVTTTRPPDAACALTGRVASKYVGASCTDLDQLDVWILRAATASKVHELF